MQPRYLVFLIPLLAFGISGCKACSSKPSPQVKTESKTKAVKTESWRVPGVYLKWVLKLSGDQVSTVELSRVDSSFQLTPQPVGNFAVVVWSGEKRKAAYPFYFPDEIHSEGVDQAGNPVSQTIKFTGNRTTHVWIKVDEPIDKLTVMSPRGQVVLETTTLGDGAPLSSVMATKSSLLTIIPQVFAQEGEATNVFVEHVRILGQDASWNLLPQVLQEKIERVYDPPPSEWVQEIAQQMREAAPPTLSAVTLIGFADYKPNERACASTVGSVILINVWQMDNQGCQGYMVHELAHAYEHLLTFYSVARDPGQAALREMMGNESPIAQWPPEIRDLAQRTVERLGIRLYQDFLGLWTMMQMQGKQFGVAGDYVGDGWPQLGNEAAARGGFARNYGGSAPAEDLATYVEQIQAPRYSPRGLPLVCQWMQNATDEIDNRTLIPYVKIVLLKNAGFLTEEKAAACYGNFAIRGERGIHFYKDDLRSPKISFTRNLKAGYETNQGVQYFDVLGDGPNTYQLLVQVISQDGSERRKIPLGLHRLDNIGPLSINLRGNNGVYLAHSNNMKARTSFSGLVLFSDYSTDPVRVEGAIFFLTLRGAMGGPPIPIHPLLALNMLNDKSAITDSFPLVTFRYEP
ncbi:MAG: hypothetical protein HYT77_06845 [Deltaproteobacteria bacterium]|nr:hypothetical protein [Deltaproteobacteria bacterium]